MTGKIVRIVKDRGFGFIRCNRTSKEYFFHMSACYMDFSVLKEGMEMSFDEGKSNKGLRAENVVPAGELGGSPT